MDASLLALGKSIYYRGYYMAARRNENLSSNVEKYQTISLL